MGNKLWIAALSFSTVLFGVFTLAAPFLGRMDHESFLHIALAVFMLGTITWRVADVTLSRIKYGPKGPPVEPPNDFHVDF